ncbi:Hypothetical protein, putative [Bodo saltans]|uniref:PDZ domain-containing protein n=1 Tax=Bodo saltans TaxID=75058 RepID=A0A0S4JLZ1_BODSA|nr:Hypothetical protein, putative [Bodo saltans]|eukprot:CUG91240.1 Hypothetical protein, putative [Bodo saltans]
MPSLQLQRKLDILSRSSTPKVLVDVIYLLVSELDKREQDQRHTDDTITELELAAKDPSRDIQRDLQSLRQSLETLRRDTQQLEHTIREAEASFVAQYEVKRAEVNESVRELRSTCERLLRDEVPTSLSAQLQRVSTVSKEITSAALSTTAESLRDMKHEVVMELEEAAKHHCATALDQLHEECQVSVFASMRRVEVDFDKIRAELESLSSAAVRDIHNRTSQCSEFLGKTVAKTLHAEPLLDVHKLMTEVQYCNAQLQFFRDTSCSNVEAALIRGKIATLEAATTALRVEQKHVVGFVSLWDADAEVLEEMAEMTHTQTSGAAASSRRRDDRIGLMKAEYLRRLPALCGFALSAESQAGTKSADIASSNPRTPIPQTGHRASNDVIVNRTPIPDPRNTLLNEMSARKSGAARGQRESAHPQRAGDSSHINISRGSDALEQPPAVYSRPGDVRPQTYEQDSTHNNVSSSVADVFAALFPAKHSSIGTEHNFINNGATAHVSARHHSSSFDDDGDDDDDGLVVDMGNGESPARSSPRSEPHHQPLGLVVSDADPLSGGVVVTRVLPLSKMEKHGVTPGDQVLSINGAMISNRDHMGAVLISVPPGEALRMHLFRPSLSKMFVVQTVK